MYPFSVAECIEEIALLLEEGWVARVEGAKIILVHPEWGDWSPLEALCIARNKGVTANNVIGIARTLEMTDASAMRVHNASCSSDKAVATRTQLLRVLGL